MMGRDFHIMYWIRAAAIYINALCPFNIHLPRFILLSSLFNSLSLRDDQYSLCKHREELNGEMTSWPGEVLHRHRNGGAQMLE
jgi:hypothetical protein